MSRRGGCRVLACILGVALGGGIVAPAVAEAPPSRPAAVALRIWVLTEAHELLQIDADRPQQVLQRVRLHGVAEGESIVGMDYRVARGQLYALSDQGRLYTLDPTQGRLQPVGTADGRPRLDGRAVGFDFNPVADRLRIVTDRGQNLRMHPDTGALVDADAAVEGIQPDGVLRYAEGDPNAGRPPRIEAAAYTYNKRDDKLTTNYAIDAGLGLLVRQGSLEGAQPVVSPNTGWLFTVGSLGLPTPLRDVSFDIADLDNTAWAAMRWSGQPAAKLVRIDLDRGEARIVGVIGTGEPVRALAIEP
ncbi:DUF4394 domain-containing protein [Caldimonas sp.]|uniref:DUF4394 domain-containing protein n=1 Tax=Caldimonas sp. TaxID=2838790 RepID=UPI0029DC3DFD|nr:DUF4394 domain-containing protein [Caldimonas manganoxidans]